MAFSKLVNYLFCPWAPVLVAFLIFQQQHHHHNLVVGFEYLEWREFKSRDDASLGVTLTLHNNSSENETNIVSDTGKDRKNRAPREVDFYKPYGFVHKPNIHWDWIKEDNIPALPLETEENPPDWYHHKYTARNSIFPSQAIIIFKDKDGKLDTCGCILIHNDLIMTTRRCLESKVAAKVVIRRHRHNDGIRPDRTVYAFVRGFCVLDKNSKDYDNDVAIGYLATKIQYRGTVWPAAILSNTSKPISQHVGVVREGNFNGYNLLQIGCSKSPVGQEKDRTCYTTTTDGSRHICDTVDEGMGLYHLTNVNVNPKDPTKNEVRIYLAGIMSQAEQGPPGCQKDTPEGQWVYYVDFKKIPKLKEMITKCYS